MCVNIYLATIYVSTKLWPEPSSNMAAILENQLRAIDPKLCTYVPLGKSNSQTKFRSSLILSLATRGPKPKTDITPELMAGSCPNFYHRYKDTCHNTRVFDLTYFSQGSKFKTYYKVGLFCYCSNFARTSWFVLLLFDLDCSGFVLVNHSSFVITHATIPMSQHLNPR
jgi:hypothetical protein